MTALPPWADNAEGRRLLASIVANPPETRIVRDDWGSRTVYRSWQRPDVAALKRMERDWWNANFETGIRRPESADDVIGRMLPERADLAPKELPNGRFQVAA